MTFNARNGRLYTTTSRVPISVAYKLQCLGTFSLF